MSRVQNFRTRVFPLPRPVSPSRSPVKLGCLITKLHRRHNCPSLFHQRSCFEASSSEAPASFQTPDEANFFPGVMAKRIFRIRRFDTQEPERESLRLCRDFCSLQILEPERDPASPIPAFPSGPRSIGTRMRYTTHRKGKNGEGKKNGRVFPVDVMGRPVPSPP